MEAKTARYCEDGMHASLCKTDEEWANQLVELDGMVDKLDQFGLKGTF